eukprot:gene12898-biopygen10284
MASTPTARNEPSEPSSSAATTESTSQLSEDNVQQIRAIVEESMEASLSRVAREAAQAAVELTLANRSTPPTAPENTIITQPSIDEFERLGRASIPINGSQHRSQAIDGGFTPEIPNAYVRSIQGGEFFEISKLLPENLYQLDNSSPDYNNVSLSMGPNSELRLTKRSSVKRIENISEWTSAFLAYVKLVRGIKRSQGQKNNIRRPITAKHLNLFFELLRPYTTRHFDSIMLWAAMCLAFFGFLRISEFTSGQRFDKHCHLSHSDIKLLPNAQQPTHLRMDVKSSKIDPFRQGVSLVIGATNNSLCAVKALQCYLELSPFTSGPLFRYRSGQPLSRDTFTKDVRNLLSQCGFSSSEFAGHSFRIGAATSAAAAKMPSWLIKTLGRWTSDCYERYVRTPETVLLEASKNLSRTDNL